jgi:hypothetical protein
MEAGPGCRSSPPVAGDVADPGRAGGAELPWSVVPTDA